MEKVKIFLVEDEIVIRNGIKNSIEWEKEGYEFVGEASDGELAYPMIVKERPDILITDIKMPFMDGLELSRLVRKELPELKILILSGYDEFDYAKEAISLGVTEYLLKPVSSAKLLETLKGVSVIIEQEREERDLLKRYSEEMKESTEHEKMRFFGQLISEDLTMGEILETGKKFEMDLSAQAYEVILFKILTSLKNDGSGEHLAEACDAVEELAARLPYVYGFQRGVDGWAFLMTAEDEAQMKERAERFAGKLKTIMEQWKNLEYFGGIGCAVLRLRELRRSFREADKAFAGRFTHDPNQIITTRELQGVHDMDDFQVRGFGEIERTRGQIEKFLNNGTEEEIESFSRAYIDEISVENFRSSLMRQYIIMDVYIVIMSFCEKLEISDARLKEDVEELKEAMHKIHSLEEIRKWMIRLLTRAIEVRDTASGRRYSDIIEAAKIQIENTYMAENISLNTVAASVGMSPSYFSSVFSREVGKTFVEYLTETRMEKAKELLMCSPLKTSEIGYEVGYKDPHYFSYIFKKTQGCSPKDYRARRKE